MPDSVSPASAVPMNTPEICVVIPAYRAAQFIGKAIDSALSQTDVALEVIVVDDHCPDDTHAAVTARYGHVANLSVVRLDRNGGPSAARNAGFAAARAPWIAVLDADDALEPGRLRHLLDVAGAFAADMVADNVRFLDEAQAALSPPQIQAIRSATEIDRYAFVAAARPFNQDMDYGLLKPMFRRQFLEDHAIRYDPAIRHGEDFKMYFDAMLCGAKFVITPQPGYVWTLRTSGKSQTTVDYTAQIAMSASLAKRSDVVGDGKLVALLHDRRRALGRLETLNGFRQALQSGKRVQAIRLFLGHPFIVRQYAGRAIRKVARLIR